MSWFWNIKKKDLKVPQGKLPDWACTDANTILAKHIQQEMHDFQDSLEAQDINTTLSSESRYNSFAFVYFQSKIAQLELEIEKIKENKPC